MARKKTAPAPSPSATRIDGPFDVALSREPGALVFRGGGCTLRFGMDPANARIFAQALLAFAEAEERRAARQARRRSGH